MILSAGDIISAKRKLRIEIIDSANRTVLVTDLDTNKTDMYSWETIQQIDSFLHFDVKKVEIEKE